MDIFGLEIKRKKRTSNEKKMRFLKKSFIYSNLIILAYIITYLGLCYLNNTIPDGTLTERIFSFFCFDSLGKTSIKIAEIIFENKKGTE